MSCYYIGNAMALNETITSRECLARANIQN